MRWSPLRLIPKKFLGIDIGTSSIKLVELSRWGDRKKLENYAEASAEVVYEKPFRTFEKSTLFLSSKDISRAIKGCLEEAKIKTRQCIFSIPDFSSFFTNFELPLMTKEELPQAVKYEARQHIPLPLNEVALDWQIIEGEGKILQQKKENIGQQEKIKVLLVAVPNEVINQYREIAGLANLELVSLEAEVFGLARSLIGEDDRRIISIIDIGAQSTTCSIIEKKVLKTSHSFDVGGNEFTERIAKSLAIDYSTAANFKKKYGISSGESLGLATEKNLREILLPLINLIFNEVGKILRNFSQTQRKDIQKIIIAGATALLPGLKEYAREHFNAEAEKIQYGGEKIEIEIANPFSAVYYPPILEQTLTNMGPSYAIAVGIALRGLE